MTFVYFHRSRSPRRTLHGAMHPIKILKLLYLTREMSHKYFSLEIDIWFLTVNNSTIAITPVASDLFLTSWERGQTMWVVTDDVLCPEQNKNNHICVRFLEMTLISKTYFLLWAKALSNFFSVTFYRCTSLSVSPCNSVAVAWPS